jgi:pseudouridine 5'-phosphatase
MASQAPGSSGLPKVRACIFDMDGLLLNTEDLYSVVMNELLREYGKPDIPWSIKAQLQGRPGPEASRIFHEWAQLPITPEKYSAKNSALQRKYFSSAEPLPGVTELLETLRYRCEPKVELALATSSHKEPFDHKTTNHRELFTVFDEDHRVLGDDPRVKKGRGKPAPDIFLIALQTINDRRRKESLDEIKPAECLVFKDGIPGVEAGRRAGMQVVWCPHPGLLQECKGKEKEVLAGLTGGHQEQEQKDQSIGVEAGDGSGRRAGAPGEIDDGWVTLLPSLENFPYERYGISSSAEVANGK